MTIAVCCTRWQWRRLITHMGAFGPHLLQLFAAYESDIPVSLQMRICPGRHAKAFVCMVSWIKLKYFSNSAGLFAAARASGKGSVCVRVTLVRRLQFPPLMFHSIQRGTFRTSYLRNICVWTLQITVGIHANIHKLPKKFSELQYSNACEQSPFTLSSSMDICYSFGKAQE